MTDEHFHVFGVQDYGGSREEWTGWNDRLTRAQAEALASDMLKADQLMWA